MQPWVSSALIAAVFIAVHYLFLRAASGKVGDTLGALCLEGAAVFGIALGYVVGFRGPVVPTTTRGIVCSIFSGFAISGASILLYAALRKGGPVASTGTIVLGGGVVLSSIVAPWIFGDSWTTRRALGIGMGVCAMALVSSEGE